MYSNKNNLQLYYYIDYSPLSFMTNSCKACTPGNFRTMSHINSKKGGDITSFYRAEQSISNIWDSYFGL